MQKRQVYPTVMVGGSVEAARSISQAFCELLRATEALSLPCSMPCHYRLIEKHYREKLESRVVFLGISPFNGSRVSYKLGEVLSLVWRAVWHLPLCFSCTKPLLHRAFTRARRARRASDRCGPV